nr:nickel transporter [Aquabacterium terrae]
MLVRSIGTFFLTAPQAGAAPMSDLPTDFAALAALALLFGLKHGLDADHLATIDGMTRLQQREGRRVARWCGALFSLGHGAVVIAAAGALAAASRPWAPPEWLQTTGASISIAVLLVLGIANLRALFSARPGEAPKPVGLRARLLGRWIAGRSPWTAAATGALFALSFDTLSQAALFALASPALGGPAAALALALLFTAGMLATDALNGWWVHRLLQRADGFALRASQLMGAAVVLLSFGVAGLGLARLAAASGVITSA